MPLYIIRSSLCVTRCSEVAYGFIWDSTIPAFGINVYGENWLVCVLCHFLSSWQQFALLQYLFIGLLNPNIFCDYLVPVGIQNSSTYTEELVTSSILCFQSNLQMFCCSRGFYYSHFSYDLYQTSKFLLLSSYLFRFTASVVMTSFKDINPLRCWYNLPVMVLGFSASLVVSCFLFFVLISYVFFIFTCVGD